MDTPRDRPLRMLIADDHPLFRQGLRGALAVAEGIAVVGEAATGEEAIDLAERVQPDVVLMDLTMPGVNGIEATRRILDSRPQIGIGCSPCTTTTSPSSPPCGRGHGATCSKGPIKRGPPRHPGGRQRRSPLQSGDRGPVDPVLRVRATRATREPPVFPELTEREREVLVWLAQGYTNAAIAERLVLSPKTVRNHVSTIFSKLQVAGRAEAMLLAREAGLGRE